MFRMMLNFADALDAAGAPCLHFRDRLRRASAARSWPKSTVMNRKLLIALGAIVFVSGVIVWRHLQSSTRGVAELSQEDFERIRRVTRVAMWRRAFPDFSRRTILGTPRSLYRIATSRIGQIDILPGHLQVRVQTGSDDYFYFVQKYQQKAGWEDWRVVRQSAADEIVINLNGGPGFTEIRVDGGFGLVGGRLSTGPVPWEDWLPSSGSRSGRATSRQRHNSPEPEVSASGSNQVRLTYETQPVPWEAPPGYTEPWNQRSVPETPFSASLSNSAGLNLRP